MKHETRDALIRACEAWEAIYDLTQELTAEEFYEQFCIASEANRIALQLLEESRADRSGPRFSGAFYNPLTDEARLEKQLGRVFVVMSDRGWYSTTELAAKTRELGDNIDDSVESMGAQVRNLRKPQHGEWSVKSGRGADGVFRYCLWDTRLGVPAGTLPPPH